MARCPKCDGPLETARFVDSWGPGDVPDDVNEDMVCRTCDIRWVPFVLQDEWPPGAEPPRP